MKLLLASLAATLVAADTPAPAPVANGTVNTSAAIVAPLVSPLVTSLVSPAAADSGESSLFTAPDGTVYLTWAAPGDVAGERALRVATLAPGATAWSAPRIIVSSPLLMENWADFATLTVDTRGTITAQWFQTAEAHGHGYSGFVARSTDAGATWSAPAPLGHEFVSLATLADGGVLAVWLESLRVPKEKRVPGAPTMILRSRLLSPAGETLRDDIVDPDVCTCCQTTLTVLPGDEVLVAYRGHTSEEIRDNLVARFHPARGWSKPTLVHADGWKIAACPVNGPALDSRGRDTAVTWFTLAGGVARVQAKRSADAGATWSEPTPIDLGRPIGRLDLVMLRDGSALVSWLETLTDKTAGLYVRRVFADGAVSAPLLVAETATARASGFARMALRPDGNVVISYTDPAPPGPSRVLTLLLDAPALARAAAGPSPATPKLALHLPATALEICATPLHR